MTLPQKAEFTCRVILRDLKLAIRFQLVSSSSDKFRGRLGCGSLQQRLV